MCMILIKKVIQRLNNYRTELIIKHQGGEKTSKLLRDIVKKEYNVDVGMFSYGGCFDKNFCLGGKVVIGKYCSIGPSVRYFGANHPMNYASMSPYFYQQSWAESVGDYKVNDIERFTLEI